MPETEKNPPNPTQAPDKDSKPSGFPTEKLGTGGKPGPGEKTLPPR